MTARDSFIEKDLAFNMMMWLEEWDGRVPMPALLKPRPRWTGKQFISAFLPPGVNCRRTTSWYRDGEPADMSPTDSQVLIQGGQLLTGTLCKKTLGASAGSLVHVIWADEGPEAARAFLSQCQVSWFWFGGGGGRGDGEREEKKKREREKRERKRKRKSASRKKEEKKSESKKTPPLFSTIAPFPPTKQQYITNHWLLQHGFSIGIGDTVADARTMAIISRTIEGAEAEVKRLTQKLQARELEAQPGRSMMESFENQVNQVLNKARDDAGRQAQASLKDTNNVVRMVTAGSKGSFINISQMIACVGELRERGWRVEKFLIFFPLQKTHSKKIKKKLTSTSFSSTSISIQANKTWRASASPLVSQGEPSPTSPRTTWDPSPEASFPTPTCLA
jgi:DNA-directed RNA polymerase beta' subunit